MSNCQLSREESYIWWRWCDTFGSIVAFVSSTSKNPNGPSVRLSTLMRLLPPDIDEINDTLKPQCGQFSTRLAPYAYSRPSPSCPPIPIFFLGLVFSIYNHRLD